MNIFLLLFWSSKKVKLWCNPEIAIFINLFFENKSKIISSVRLSGSGHEIKNLNINLSIFCFFCIKTKEKIVFFY